MEIDIEPAGTAGTAASQREIELEEKLGKRTMFLALFIALSMTELLVMVEMFRQAN